MIDKICNNTFHSQNFKWFSNLSGKGLAALWTSIPHACWPLLHRPSYRRSNVSCFHSVFGLCLSACESISAILWVQFEISARADRPRVLMSIWNLFIWLWKWTSEWLLMGLLLLNYCNIDRNRRKFVTGLKVFGRILISIAWLWQVFITRILTERMPPHPMCCFLHYQSFSEMWICGLIIFVVGVLCPQSFLLLSLYSVKFVEMECKIRDFPCVVNDC